MATKTKQINFDVFKLTVRNTERDTIVPFDNILLTKLDTYRSSIQAGDPVFIIDEPYKSTNLIFGTFTHNQMSDIPTVVDSVTKKSTGKPILAGTEGLGHNTSFLYDEELKMISFESKKNGVTLKSFCDFYELNHLLPPIYTEIVIDPVEIQKLNSMTIIKKFSVTIAKLQGGQIFDSKKRSILGLMRYADETNTNTLNYSIAAERGKSLIVNKIKQAARDLLGFKDSDDIQRLVITGKENEDETSDTVNFITNKVRFQIKVERKRFSEDYSLKEKYDSMYEEYKKIRPGLLKAYKDRKNSNEE